MSDGVMVSEKKSEAGHANIAADIVREAHRDTGGDLPSNPQLSIIVAAIKEDLASADVDELNTEERMAKVEAQTQVLAEAVIAIAEVPVGIAPRVEAVKAEM